MPGIVTLNSINGVNRAQVSAEGALQVALPGSVLFSDPLDGSTIDTTYRWTAPVLGGGGTVTQNGNGTLTIATGTTTSNAGALTSIDKFQAIGAGFIAAGGIFQFEASVSTNTHRFFGFGTPNGSFTAATPLANAYGWEVDITGALNACTYGTNVRTFAKAFRWPSDGNPHILAIHSRADAVYFFIDNLEEPVATAFFPSAGTSNLPLRMHCINHTVAPSVAPTFVSLGAAVADLTNNYTMIFNGQTVQAQRSPGKRIIVNTVLVTGETPIWTPAAGKRFRILGYNLTCGVAAGNVLLKDNTAGNTIELVPFGTIGQNIPLQFLGNGTLSAAANNVLTATGVSTQTISGMIYGCEE